MWARPLIPRGVPIWPLVLQWERLQDAGWGALRGTPATPATLPTTPTAQSRSLPCRLRSCLPLAMAHVADARTGAGPGRSTCLSITLLALAALLCELAPFPFASWASGPGRRSSSLSGSQLSGVPSQSKTTLASFMVLVYGVHHLLRQPLPSNSG